MFSHDIYSFLATLWLSCIRYEIVMYHYLTAVNLDVCNQRQVILEHSSYITMGFTPVLLDISRYLDL